MNPDVAEVIAENKAAECRANGHKACSARGPLPFSFTWALCGVCGVELTGDDAHAAGRRMVVDAYMEAFFP